MSQSENPESDKAEFAMMAGHIRIIAEELLRKFFGERCDDFEAGCECCGRWSLLDRLTENPFEERAEDKT